MAPLSAALANGDGRLPHRGSAGRGDDQRHHGRAAGLLHRGASGRAVGRLPHSKRAGHADAGRHHGRAAGLPDGPGPGRVHHQPNHLGAGGVPFGRGPGHGNGLEHRSRAAQLLHHRTSRRPPRRQARSHGGGLGPANSRALSGRRRGRRGGGRHRRADPGPHGRLTVKLDGSPQQRLQRGLGHAHRGSERGRLHPDPSGEPVEHRAHLQLDARAGAALRLPLPARHGLQLRGAHVRGRQRLRPIVRQLRGRPGRLEHGHDVLHSAAKRSGEAALWRALPGAGPAQPDGRNGGRLRPPDPGRNPGGRQHSGGGGHGGFGAAAEARVPRRGGRRRHAGHPGRGAAGTHAHHARKFSGALQQPELRGLGQLRGGRLPAGGLRHDPERLRLEHCAHLHANAGETLLLRLPAPAGHGLQLGDVRQRGRQRLRGRPGTFLGTASQGVWSTARLDFSVPPGGIAKLHFGAFGGSIPGLVQQSGQAPSRESRSQ